MLVVPRAGRNADPLPNPPRVVQPADVSNLGPGVLSARYFSAAACGAIREAIREAAGHEVFFVGTIGSDGRIDAVEVHCRGTPDSVPAMLRVGRPGQAVLHNHPSGNLSPSDPDMRLAAHYAQEGVAFLIVDNHADRAYAVVEPRAPGPPAWTDADLTRIFTEPDGLARALPSWEARPGQRRMAAGVGRAQQDRGLYVVEAGTGTGKSLAYLLPSAVRAVRSGERIAVSTHTKHLQAQIVDKDVPIARRLVPELQVALLKGRGNYLCRRRLEERIEELSEGDHSPEAESLRQLKAWSETSIDGSRGDLPFVPDPELWESVQSSSELTLKFRCAHYDRCFYYESRRRAASAHLLVVNHHLLLADRAVREEGGLPLLPNYDHAILDEAHHLEDVATEFAGEELTAAKLIRQLGRLRPLRGREGGIVGRLGRALDDVALKGGNWTADGPALAFREAIDALIVEIERVRTTVRIVFEDWAAAVDPHLAPFERDAGAVESGPQLTLRLVDDFSERFPDLHKELLRLQGELAADLLDLEKHIEAVASAREDCDENLQQKTRGAALELASSGRRLQESASTLARILTPDAESCRWLEPKRDKDGTRDVRLCIRPIEVGANLDRLLWQKLRSAVLTSATLAVGGRFSHLEKRTGLDVPEARARVDGEIVESPFDYAQQCTLAVPSDLLEPQAAGATAQIDDAIVRIVRAARGRTFVLFTSWRALRRSSEYAARSLGRGWTLLRQGELPPAQLLDAFRRSERAVLFGTDSFWEGVDVQGEALSCVILTRLPFRVPSEPLQIARADRVTSRGGDAFDELSLPQAVVKFKQGFGRLVRHRDDRGAVVVLDPRIVRKRYGRTFLASLPDGVRPFVRPLDNVVAHVATLLGGESTGGVQWTASDSDPFVSPNP